MQRPEGPLLGPESSRAYFSADTIVAISSAVGGAIALVRLSGTKSAEISAQLSPDFSIKHPARCARRGRIIHPDSKLPLDDAIWIHYQAPKSFTGEDVIEWMIHGSPRIASALVEAAISLGARQALPGEFSFRAVRNGKLTLEQAHAVADLIAARNDGAIALALEQLSGTQRHWILTLAEDLRRLATLSELGIDFSDQNVEEVALQTLRNQCSKMIARLRNLVSTLARGMRVKEGVSVTLIGAPNAGKSSLFNALLGEDRSIVSDIPGTTRDIVRETLTLGFGRNQVTFRFSDTAGLRPSLDPIENEGISRTLSSIQNADVVLFVVDGSSPSWQDSVEHLLKQTKAPSIAIFTKIDLLVPKDQEERRLEVQNRWPELNQVWVSLLSHVGLDDVISALLEQSKTWTERDAGELLLTRLDQKNAILNCIAALERALSAPTEDLFAADIRQGLLQLAPLIGDTLPDDILGKIFSDFCIGK